MVPNLEHMLIYHKPFMMSAIYQIIKPPFDAEVAEKLLNGIYWAPYYKIMLIPSGQ